MILHTLGVILSALQVTGWAANLPTGFSEQAILGLTNPTAMTITADGRIFVCQQDGQLRLISNGTLRSAPYLTVQVDSTIERGLLGVAVSDPYIYVYYTVPTSPAHNRLSRFTQNGEQALPNSEVVLAEFEDLNTGIHNGGSMAFGPDGKLYIGLGENYNTANAQSMETRLGKIIRLNPDGTIPADNPFQLQTLGANRAIWATGLRNPFNLNFQPGTGRLFINDVGNETWEEINEGVAGSNYGWPLAEGPNNTPTFRSPVFAYNHSPTATPNGCAITGGTFYNPATANFPSNYTGRYFFADYCNGWIRSVDPNTVQSTQASELFATGANYVVALATGPDGSLYYLARPEGALYRIRYAATTPPSITQHPASLNAIVGGTAAFTVSAISSGPISYQWQRNNLAIPGATGSTLTLTGLTLADSGAQIRVVVSNEYGSVTSNVATLNVNTSLPPQVTILQPAPGSLYSAGESIAYSAIAVAGPGVDLPASSFCWQVDFQHDTHSHPFLPLTCGSRSGSVTIPNVGETASSVWYRFYLTVRNADGVGQTTYVDVQPRKSTLNLETSPPGLQLLLDGQPVVTPFAVTSVVGMIRTLGVPASQGSNGTRYQLAAWSDSGSATHTITTAAESRSYLATFTPQYQVVASAFPTNGGMVTISPASTDGYYYPGTPVTLTATPNPGSAFSGWLGGASGTTSTTTIFVTGPRFVTANFSGSTQCTYQLSRSSGSYAAGGDLGRITVETLPGCMWSASSGQSWIRLLSPATGNNDEAVTFSLDPNPLTTSRTGTITIGGLPYIVTQMASGCSVTLSSSSANAPAAGGFFQFSVTTDSRCDWAPAVTADWITTDVRVRSGPATVNLTLAANSSTMPRLGEVSVGGRSYAILQLGTAAASPYPDVPSSYLFAPFITVLKAEGAALECASGGFCPEDPTTRAEMAAFIVRSLLGPEPFTYGQTAYFTDVPASHPQFAYIQKLQELGITNGCGNNRFCPADPVTRGQMSAFLMRARFRLPADQAFPFSAAPYFDDVPSTDLFFAYIQKMRDLGITNGCTATAYCPADNNLHGQLSVFLARALLAP